MQLEYHVILQSGVVEFVIGKDRKRLSIHAALARSFPKKIFEPSLNSEIDIVVFGRCCEFVYSGDYSVPLPISRPLKSETPSKNDPPRWDPASLTANVFYPARLRSMYAALSSRLGKELPCEERVVNTDPRADHAEIFLSHAKVYQLGFRTNWVSLCAWSLYRLLHLLANFTLFDERTGDIVQLLKFVFEDSEYIENMHDILQDYAAWNVETLMQDADFQQLLDRVPSLQKAIFRLMWK
ncbi:hypothetical protein BDV18DRAFT_148488 [Aspergillus unguis]